jgi:hypothetical protein
MEKDTKNSLPKVFRAFLYLDRLFTSSAICSAKYLSNNEISNFRNIRNYMLNMKLTQLFLKI